MADWGNRYKWWKLSLFWVLPFDQCSNKMMYQWHLMQTSDQSEQLEFLKVFKTCFHQDVYQLHGRCSTAGPLTQVFLRGSIKKWWPETWGAEITPLISCSAAQRKQFRTSWLLLISLSSAACVAFPRFYGWCARRHECMHTQLHTAPSSQLLVICRTPLPEWNVEEGLSRSGTMLTSLAQWDAVRSFVCVRARVCARVCFSLRARQTQSEEVRFLKRELIRGPECFNYLTELQQMNVGLFTVYSGEVCSCYWATSWHWFHIMTVKYCSFKQALFFCSFPHWFSSIWGKFKIDHPRKILVPDLWVDKAY